MTLGATKNFRLSKVKFQGESDEAFLTFFFLAILWTRSTFLMCGSDFSGFRPVGGLHGLHPKTEGTLVHRHFFQVDVVVMSWKLPCHC